MPKSRRLSDTTLVRRSQQGDRRAFSALLARYDRRLRGLAHALLLDVGQMDAALGLSYLRAWRDVVRLSAKDDVGAWLYRSTYNACIDQLRRGEPLAATPASGQGSGGEVDPVVTSLASLAPADRVAVVLVDREGFTPASAARILGLTPSVLTTRLEVARERLAGALGIPPPASEGVTGEPEPSAGHDVRVSADGVEPRAGDAEDVAIDAGIAGETTAAATGHGNGHSAREDSAAGDGGGDGNREPAEVAGAAGATEVAAGDGEAAGATEVAAGDGEAAEGAGATEVAAGDGEVAAGDGEPAEGAGAAGDGGVVEVAAGDGETAEAADVAAGHSEAVAAGNGHGNGNGDGQDTAKGRGRRARRRARYASSRQTSDRAATTDDDAP
jgi:RNA polymerase sigma-70 factor, ECF subfamily